MPVLVLGLSHHTAPVAVRERFAFTEAKIPAALQQLCQSGLAQEAVILSTCNRTELYVACPDDGCGHFPALQQCFVELSGYHGPLGSEIYGLAEPQSVEHLFKVACGLDSMVLGETEVLGQLKKAYQIALAHRFTGPRLNKAFQKAFQVAKQVRTETSIQRGSVSVGSVAVELAEKIFTSLDDGQVLVIGAGETSERTARALLSRGAKSIIVSNRSYERAEALAAELGGRAVHLEDWPACLPEIDIIISSTAAPHYILDRAKLEPLVRSRKNRALLIIDIAVPRDVDPEVNLLENVYLYNIDDLQSIADSYLKIRQEEISRCLAIIREKVKVLLGRDATPGAAPGSGFAYGHEL